MTLSSTKTKNANEVFPISEILGNKPLNSEDLYHQAIERISLYWRGLFKPGQIMGDSEAYSPENRKPAWFGDLASWLEPLRSHQTQTDSRAKSTTAQQKFRCQFTLPTSINRDLAMISVELNTLLPKDEPLVKALLPVLIYSYFLNRKNQGEPELDSNGYPIDEASLQGTGKLYVDLKMNAWQDYLVPNMEENPLHKRAQRLFHLKNWTFEYPTLTLNSLQNGQKKAQLQKILGKILLFTTLAYRLRDTCNVTMSIDAFESLTGYLSMISVELSPIYEKARRRTFSPAIDPFRQELIRLLKERQIENLDSENLDLLYYRFQYLFRYELWYREHENENRAPTEDEMDLIRAGCPGLDLIIEGERRAYYSTRLKKLLHSQHRICLRNIKELDE